MLIEFQVKNFKSIKNLEKLSMVTIPALKDSSSKGTFKVLDLTLSKVTAIYGANASGKSNVWLALSTMKNIVTNSFKDIEGQSLKAIIPYLLDLKSEKEPTLFEVSIIIDDKKYRYGFEANQNSIIREWLYLVKKTTEKELFTRKNNKITLSAYTEGKGIDASTRENSLFLTAAATNNRELALKIYNWFLNQFNLIQSVNDDPYAMWTVTNFDDIGKENILNILQAADLGIEDIEKKVEVFNEIPQDVPEEIKRLMLARGTLKEFKQFKFFTKHTKYTEKAPIGFANFDFGFMESEGTKKVFHIAGPILDTIKNSKVLFVDEFETRLHPLLFEFLVKLFRDSDSNAQLIFCTHNTYLMQKKTLRRDQIWFTDKNRFGETSLYSLSDFKPRKDALYEKGYLEGIFGAIPNIDED